MNRGAVIFAIVFYFLYISIGFIPVIYESDYYSFLANQFCWILVSIVLYTCVTDYRLKKISCALILLNTFEFIDEAFGLNSYNPLHRQLNINKLLLDFLIVFAITIFTYYRIIKQWKKKT